MNFQGGGIEIRVGIDRTYDKFIFKLIMIIIIIDISTESNNNFLDIITNNPHIK